MTQTQVWFKHGHEGGEFPMLASDPDLRYSF